MKKAIVIFPKNDDFYSNSLIKNGSSSMLDFLEKMSLTYEILVMTARPYVSERKKLVLTAPFIQEVYANVNSVSTVLKHIESRFEIAFAIDEDEAHREEYLSRSIIVAHPDFVLKNREMVEALSSKNEPEMAADPLLRTKSKSYDYDKNLNRIIGSFEEVKVEDILKNGADFFESRRVEYGEEYLKTGRIRKALFPSGITLETEDDFYYFHLIDMLCMKLSRIAEHLGERPAFGLLERHHDLFRNGLGED